MDQDVLDKLISYALKYWHRRATVFLLAPLLFVGALVFFANVDLKSLSPAEWAVAALLSLIFIVAWYISNRVPKTEKGKIGFVIALSAETPEEHDVIQADFVRSLQNALAETHEDGSPEFHFILLPARHAKQIHDSDTATRYIRLCRANLLLFGDARIRKLDGKDVHALRLRQLVVHRQVPKEWSKKLSEEMARVFPQQVYVSRENDLLNFQLTSEWLSEAARYFLANAALFSGDLDVAQFFLEHLKTSKRLIEYKSIPGVSHLRALVPQRLAEVYGLQSRFAYTKWTETRDLADLEIGTKYLAEFHTLQPEDIRYYLGMSVWHFVKDRDVVAALNELEHCRGKSDATWRYSVAFLEAYRGDLRQAERVYAKAFSRPVPHHIPFEIEDFIGWILEQEPDKFQLHYCLGLINLHAKRDMEMARQDFELFIEKASAHNAFPHQVEDAKEHVNKLKRENSRIGQYSTEV